MQVATHTPPLSIPALPRVCGLTNRIWAIVRNVVAPATNSVRTLVPCFESSKVRSSKPSCRAVVSLMVSPPALLQHSDACVAAHQHLAEFNSEFDINPGEDSRALRCGIGAGALHHG